MLHLSVLKNNSHVSVLLVPYLHLTLVYLMKLNVSSLRKTDPPGVQQVLKGHSIGHPI